MKTGQKTAIKEAENARLRAENLALHQRLEQVEKDKLKAEQDNRKLEEANQNMAFERELMQLEMNRLRQIIFGQKRERFVESVDPAQLTLELELEQNPSGLKAETEQEEIAYTRKKTKRTHKPTGRQPWPAHLKRVEVIIEPAGDLIGMKKIGEHRTEELDYIPSAPFVRVFVRPIYAALKPDPETQKTLIVNAEMPDRIIPKSSVGPGLLAAIVCDKFMDHLPIYRQIKRYLRLGVKLPRSTVDNWLRLLAVQLEPLGEALHKEVFDSSYLQVDETIMKVLSEMHQRPKAKKKEPPGKTHKGYFWSYYAHKEKLCWFEYCTGRGKEHPEMALDGYQGIIQTDGYAAYNQFAQSKVIDLMGCLAHVRRKFFEAKANDKQNAEKALSFIQKLYAIEKKARNENLNDDQRLALRKQEALDIWTQFSAFLDQQATQSLPQSPIGKAFTYAINRRPFVEKYLYNGSVEIDNNLVENQIRPIALGRKNYLFAGSEKGAQRAALFYALLASAKLNDIDPFTWLHDVMLRLPSHPISKIDQLLPHKWKPGQNIPPALKIGPEAFPPHAQDKVN